MMYDDHVTGIDGEQVMVPAGTQMQIQHWTIHRAKKFWGPTAGLDEGLLQFSLSNLLYMENPYIYKKKCQ